MPPSRHSCYLGELRTRRELTVQAPCRSNRYRSRRRTVFLSCRTSRAVEYRETATRPDTAQTSRLSDEDQPTDVAEAGDDDDDGDGYDGRSTMLGLGPDDGRGSTWRPEVGSAVATGSARAQ